MGIDESDLSWPNLVVSLVIEIRDQFLHGFELLELFNLHFIDNPYVQGGICLATGNLREVFACFIRGFDHGQFKIIAVIKQTCWHEIRIN